MTQDQNMIARPLRVLMWGILLASLVAIGWMLGGRAKNSDAAPPVAAAEKGGALSLEALEQKAKANADDSASQLILARHYFDLGRFDDAVNAYAAATRASPGSAQAWSGLGEARVMASRQDPMPPEALEAFRKAVAADASDPRARYFLAVKKDLDGDHQGAIADWTRLLADTPPGAPWEADLRRTIEQVGKINKIDVASRIAAAGKAATRAPVARAIPGPSSKDIQAAAALRPAEQREMAVGMVSRLEQRLAKNPGNVDGWLMLIRSRVTLEQPDLARAALNRAVSANPQAEAQIRQQAAMLGVK